MATPQLHIEQMLTVTSSRLARRGGVKRISSNIYPVVRTVIRERLEEVQIYSCHLWEATLTSSRSYAKSQSLLVSAIIHDEEC